MARVIVCADTGERCADYDEYMRSEHWRRIRERYFAGHDKACAACDATRRIELHHKTYERIGREDVADLVPLCARHHRAAHKRRIPGAAVLGIGRPRTPRPKRSRDIIHVTGGLIHVSLKVQLARRGLAGHRRSRHPTGSGRPRSAGSRATFVAAVMGKTPPDSLYAVIQRIKRLPDAPCCGKASRVGAKRLWEASGEGLITAHMLAQLRAMRPDAIAEVAYDLSFAKVGGWRVNEWLRQRLAEVGVST